jgi:2-dehydro-3-deoxygluconokinase
MGKILTFGEIMLRLMSEDGHRLLQTNKLEATYGGGEANVAASLANFGEDAAFLTCLPKNAIGQAAINSLRYFGVDTSRILRQGDRVGVYFVEKGHSQRPSTVLYDRKYSAVAISKPEDYDWDKLFDGVEWFHFTGITPALSSNLVQVCKEAVMAASQKKIQVSCDLNYRKNLWSSEQAKETMSALMPYVNVCIANEEDAEKVLGIKAEGADVESGKLNYDGYKSVAAQLVNAYGFDFVGITLRSSIDANNNNWAGMLYDGKESYFSRTYEIRVFDRIGGGDSFSGGLIYAIKNQYDPQKAIEFAVAASCLKHSIEGDFNRVTLEEVNSLMKGNATGRVQR